MRRTTIFRLIAATALVAVALVPAAAGAQAEDHVLPLLPIQGSWGLVEDRSITALEVGFPEGYADDVWLRRWTDGADSIIVALAGTPTFENATGLLTAVRTDRERSIVGTVSEIGGSFVVADPAGSFSSGVVFQRGLFVGGAWSTPGVDLNDLAAIAVAQADYIGEAMRAQAQAELDAAAIAAESGSEDDGKPEENAVPADAPAAEQPPSSSTEPVTSSGTMPDEGADSRVGAAGESGSSSSTSGSGSGEDRPEPGRRGPAVFSSLIPFLAAFGAGSAAGRLINLAVGRTIGNPWAVGVGAVSATWAIILARSIAGGFELADFGAYTVVAGVLIVVGVNLSYRIRNPWTPSPVYVDVQAIEAHLAEHAAEGEIIRVAADPFA